MASGASQRDQILYASGNFGKSTIASMLELFALFYFTDILNIRPSVAGTIILISLLWDGISDPFLAILANRFRHRFPTVKIYFYIGVPLTAITTVLLFQASHIPGNAQVFYLLTIMLLYRTAYTIVDVPHNSLLGFLTKKPDERTNIASLRIFFSSLGRLLVTGASAYILDKNLPTDAGDQFAYAAIGFASVYVIVMLTSLRAVRQVKIFHKTEPVKRFMLADIWHSFTNNKYLWIVFGLTATTSLTTNLFGAWIVYFGKYATTSQSSVSTALIIFSVSQAFSLILWSKLSNHVTGKRRASQLANLTLILAITITLLNLSSMNAFFLTVSLTGIALGGIYMLNWSILPDALDQGQGINGRRFDLVIFGFFTLINKVCGGVSQAYVGWVLAYHGYIADSAGAASSIQSITISILLAPLFGSIICILLLHSYKMISSPGPASKPNA